MMKLLENKTCIHWQSHRIGHTHLHYVLFITNMWLVYANKLDHVTALDGAVAIAVITRLRFEEVDVAWSEVPELQTRHVRALHAVDHDSIPLLCSIPSYSADSQRCETYVP